MKTFDQKLEKLCRGRRWKQAALMNAVNDHCRDDPVSKSTVSRWLNGEGKPFDQWALALARALDVPLDYLADDAQDDPPRSELRPDERSLIEIFRGLRDNEGMTLEEARDRLMARTAEAIERLLTWIEGGREKAGQPVEASRSGGGKPAHVGPFTPGSIVLDTTTDKEEERRRREAERSAIDPGAEVNGTDPPGRPPVPKRGRKR